MKILIDIKQLVILLSLLFICATTSAANAPETMHKTYISAADLEQLISEGDAPTIIDVRSSYEYQAGHVPGAIHIPFWAALSRVDEISAPKDKPIVVYCAHGPRAGIGKFALIRAGFTQVLYLEGHMTGWYKAGLPVEKGQP